LRIIPQGKMKIIRLIHWNSVEAKERARRLETWGYRVIGQLPPGPALLKEIRQTPPAAMVIDLGRLPSQGRDLGLALRQSKSTRFIPLIFINGDAEKSARVKEVLPDAVYTDWEHLQKVMTTTLLQPVSNPVVPRSIFAAYSGRPLARKLGIRPESTIVLHDATQDFEKALGHLPPGVKILYNTRKRADLAIWFVRSAGELRRGLKRRLFSETQTSL
jgi:CheY-like chemotaxis protein